MGWCALGIDEGVALVRCSGDCNEMAKLWMSMIKKKLPEIFDCQASLLKITHFGFDKKKGFICIYIRSASDYSWLISFVSSPSCPHFSIIMSLFRPLAVFKDGCRQCDITQSVCKFLLWSFQHHLQWFHIWMYGTDWLTNWLIDCAAFAPTLTHPLVS